MPRFAIEVEKVFAAEFSVPGGTIIETAYVEDNDTYGFIVESKGDLRLSAIDIPGVISVEPLGD